MFMYPQFIKVAVVGDTQDGIEEALAVLSRRGIPIEKMRVITPRAIAGSEIQFEGRQFVAEEITREILREIDLAYLTRDDRTQNELEPGLVKAGVGVVHISAVMFLEAA